MDLSFAGPDTALPRPGDTLHLPIIRAQFNAAPSSLQENVEAPPQLSSQGNFLEEIITFRKKNNPNE
jgi:hypothetical protein